MGAFMGPKPLDPRFQRGLEAKAWEVEFPCHHLGDLRSDPTPIRGVPQEGWKGLGPAPLHCSEEREVGLKAGTCPLASPRAAGTAVLSERHVSMSAWGTEQTVRH